MYYIYISLYRYIHIGGSIHIYIYVYGTVSLNQNAFAVYADLSIILRRQQLDSHGRASSYLLAACAQQLSKVCMLKYCSQIFSCSGSPHSVAKRPCLWGHFWCGCWEHQLLKICSSHWWNTSRKSTRHVCKQGQAHFWYWDCIRFYFPTPMHVGQFPKSRPSVPITNDF